MQDPDKLFKTAEIIIQSIEEYYKPLITPGPDTGTTKQGMLE